MAYFKIGDMDLSPYINSLKINRTNNFNSQTNAAGNMVVDYINSKRVIEVGIIPVDSEQMLAIQEAIYDLQVTISFRDPQTGELEEGVACILPSNDVDYYTIQSNKVMFKPFTLSFTEL
jgi:hypothetical protein